MPPLPPPVADTHGIELPPRYRICLLTEEYLDWVKALYSDGFLLRPIPWVAMTRTPPGPPASRRNLALRAFTELDGFHRYLVTSGLSYAIFDAEYKFKRPGSAVTGGHLYHWGNDDNILHAQQGDDDGNGHSDDDDDNDDPATRLAEGMDFPLVCFGLSYDGFTPPPADIQEALHAFYPLRRPFFAQVFDGRDARPPGQRGEPTGPRQVLTRSGCITKRGYEGRGLMTALNRFVLLEARARGFRAVSLGTNSPSVMRSYFKGEDDHGGRLMAAAGIRCKVVAHVEDLFEIRIVDEERGGKEVYPFRGHEINREVWGIWCDLAASPSPLH